LHAPVPEVDWNKGKRRGEEREIEKWRKKLGRSSEKQNNSEHRLPGGEQVREGARSS